LNGVFDTDEIHCPTLGKGNAKFHGHETLPLLRKQISVNNMDADMCSFHIMDGSILPTSHHYQQA
jgi:hypothetical protein